MREHELVVATAAFVRADIEYIRLVQNIVHYKNRGTPGISEGELQELRHAKAHRAALEEELYLLMMQAARAQAERTTSS